MKGLFALLVGKLGTRTILTWLLLLIAQASIALALNSLVRGLDAPLVLMVMTIGLSIGWIVAKIGLPGWLAGIVSMGLGIGIVITRVGRLEGRFFSLIQALGDLIEQCLQWQMLRPFPDAKPTQQILSQLAADVSALMLRLRDWLIALATGAASFDPVAAALMWCFILWTIAVWAAWVARRQERSFEALLPGIALLSTILAYVGGSPGFLLPGLSALLLLMVLTSAGVRERRWNTNGIDFAEDIRFDLAAMGILVSFCLIVAAAAMPSISVAQIAQSMEHWLTQPAGESNRLTDSLGLIPQPKPPTVFDSVRSPGLPQQHLIGAGPELSKQLALIVTTDDANETSPSHYYWRSTTYERYTGRGWTTDAREIINYRAGDQMINEARPTMRVVHQRVQVQSNASGLLFATGALVTADHDFQVAWRSQMDEDLFGANIQAKSYQVDSRVSVASAAELRVTGSNYPAWIRTRYLVVPEDVPSRVLSLARDLTATAPTSYNRARAIETFLRGFPYTLDLPTPPLNRDVVDYFLFDLKRGYCDYYSSAMVVLARAAGLPARLVVGYATGTYDSTNGRYVVTEADAHSWVEIYFPDYGWIEFEPTGGREPIDRSAQSVTSEKHPSGEQPGQLPNAQTMPSNNWWLIFSIGLVLFMLGILVWIAMGAWRLYRLAPEPAIYYIYGQLCLSSNRLGMETRTSNTPAEIGQQLIDRLSRIAKGKRTKAWQQTHDEIQSLIATYVQASYSPYRPDSNVKRQAVRTWEHLRWRLWLAWVTQSYRRWVRRS